MMNLLLPLIVLVQAAPAPATPEKKPVEAKQEKELAWPKLPPAKQEELLGKLVLYKRATADKLPTLAKEIAAYGKGAVPAALSGLSRAEADMAPRYQKLLDLLAEDGDAPLLLKELESKSSAVRLYVLKRALTFAKPEHAPALEKVLGDSDAEVRFYSALALAHAKSFAGFSELLAEINARWDTQKKEILKAVEGLRGPEASKKLITSLSNQKEDDATLATLRLLGGVGDQSAVSSVYYYLDSNNNRFKEEAVNALRGIVDKEPPLENLSVFDLIEQANQWKSKLGGKKKN